MYTIGLRKLNQERHWSWLLSLRHSTGNSRMTRLLIAHSSIVDDVWNLGGCQDLWDSRKSRPGSVGRWWIFATWKRHLKPTHPPRKSSSFFCWVDFSSAMKQKKQTTAFFLGRMWGFWVWMFLFWGSPPHETLTLGAPEWPAMNEWNKDSVYEFLYYSNEVVVSIPLE